MRGVLAFFLAALASATPAVPPVVFWKVVDVIDYRTLKLESEKGKIMTVSLGCVGETDDRDTATAYVKTRVKGQKMLWWAFDIPSDPTPERWSIPILRGE